jgi:hypothetical protein
MGEFDRRAFLRATTLGGATVVLGPAVLGASDAYAADE